MKHENLSKFKIILPSHINERLNELGFYDTVINTNPKSTLIDELINLYIAMPNQSHLSQVVWDCLVDGYIYLQRLNYNFYVRAISDIKEKISLVDSSCVNDEFSIINDLIVWVDTYIQLLENYPEYKKSLMYCGACSLYFKF